MSDSEEAAPEPTGVPLDKLAKVCRKMSAEIQRLTQEYDNATAQIKQQQDTIKTAIKDEMLRLGVKSVRTDGGTISLSTKTRYSTEDWDALTNAGQNSGNLTPDTIGSFNVKEAFGEVQIPLLKGLPFAESLSLQGAARSMARR